MQRRRRSSSIRTDRQSERTSRICPTAIRTRFCINIINTSIYIYEYTVYCKIYYICPDFGQAPVNGTQVLYVRWNIANTSSDHLIKWSLIQFQPIYTIHIGLAFYNFFEQIYNIYISLIWILNFIKYFLLVLSF